MFRVDRNAGNGGNMGGGAAAEGFSHRWGQGVSAVSQPAAISAGPRLGPQLDPYERVRQGRLVKWGILVGLICLIAAVPTLFYYFCKWTEPIKADPANPTFFAHLWHMAMAGNTALFAAIAATAIPRLLILAITRLSGNEALIQRFTMWSDAADALRDWLIVGVVTSVVYNLLLLFVYSNPAWKTTWGQAGHGWPFFYQYRMPLVLISAAVGITLARMESARRGFIRLTPEQTVWALIWTILQMTLMGVLFFYVQTSLYGAFDEKTGPHYVPALGWAILFTIAGAGLLLFALGIAGKASVADRELVAMQGRGGASGVMNGKDPISLTITIVGGRSSGKTALLSGAYQEWINEWQRGGSETGGLAMVPILTSGGYDLERIANGLYPPSGKGQFPGPTVVCRNLPFHLMSDDRPDLGMSKAVVARMDFLDYPGGAIAGAAPDPEDARTFDERVAYTDAIVLVADMSASRRGIRDAEYRDVLTKYHDVMNRIALRNGKRRVIPVALVLTKCDEFFQAGTTTIDEATLQAAFRASDYHQLEPAWNALTQNYGLGIAEFSTWRTSAITFSTPGRNPMGGWDFSQPFDIHTPPPRTCPSGCASPLLWISAKSMRWNATLSSDLKSFFWGPSPELRTQMRAIDQLERVAHERAEGM